MSTSSEKVKGVFENRKVDAKTVVGMIKSAPTAILVYTHSFLGCVYIATHSRKDSIDQANIVFKIDLEFLQNLYKNDSCCLVCNCQGNNWNRFNQWKKGMGI